MSEPKTLEMREARLLAKARQNERAGLGPTGTVDVALSERERAMVDVLGGAS